MAGRRGRRGEGSPDLGAARADGAGGAERGAGGGDGAPPGVWAPQRRRITTGLVLTVTLVAFETLSVATVLPAVSRSLGDLRLYGWVFSAFLLTSLVGIALAGSLADRRSLVEPMVAGLVLFGAGLVIGGTAGDMPVLVVGRAVQGLGAGAVPAVAYVTIGRAYPDALHPRMFAVLSTAWVVPGLVGPAVAAVIASTVGWRWVFLGLVPLVVVAVVLAARGLADVAGPAPGQRAPMAILPAVGVAAGAGVVLAGLSSASPLWTPLGVVTGGVVLVPSLRRLTPPGMLRAGAGLPATVLSRGLLTLSFFAGDAYVPYALATVRHGGTALAGVALTAGTMTWTAGSWIQARWLRRFGPRRLVASGDALVALGLVLMLVTLLPPVPSWFGVVAWSVACLGIGTAYAPLSVTALDRAPTGGEGRTTAGLQLTDVLGQALGTGAAGAAVAVGAHGLGRRDAVGLAFAAAVVVAAVALAVTRRLPTALRSEDPVPDAPVVPAPS